MQVRCKNTQEETDEIKMLAFRDSLLILVLVSLIILMPSLMMTVVNMALLCFVGFILWKIEENHQIPRARLNVWELRLFL